eukprot:scaffold131718_cov26-Tisochrysis_lutea.AAC.1
MEVAAMAEAAATAVAATVAASPPPALRWVRPPGTPHYACDGRNPKAAPRVYPHRVKRVARKEGVGGSNKLVGKVNWRNVRGVLCPLSVFAPLFDTVQRPRTIPVVAAAFKCTPLHASFAQQNYFNATMRTMCESRYEDGAADFSASDCSAGCSPCVYMQNANGLYAHLGG